MAIIEINPERPITANVRLLSPDGTPYAPGVQVKEPRRTGRPIPSDVPVLPPAEMPRPTTAGGVKVLFGVGDHEMTASFNEVATSVGSNYLVFDVTGRDDAFLPFKSHLYNHRPTAEVISALPAGGQTAFSLAVTHSPPIGLFVGGRKLYLVPIVETGEVPPDRAAVFSALTETAPTHEEVTRGKERHDRPGHTAGPDGLEGVHAPAADSDEPAELVLPGEEPAVESGRSVPSVLV